MVHIYTDTYHGYTVKLGTTALHNIKGICCWLALLIMELISVQRDQQCCKEKPVKGGSKHHEIGGLVGAKFGILHWWNKNQVKIGKYLLVVLSKYKRYIFVHQRGAMTIKGLPSASLSLSERGS